MARRSFARSRCRLAFALQNHFLCNCVNLVSYKLTTEQYVLSTNTVCSTQNSKCQTRRRHTPLFLLTLNNCIHWVIYCSCFLHFFFFFFFSIYKITFMSVCLGGKGNLLANSITNHKGNHQQSILKRYWGYNSFPSHFHLLHTLFGHYFHSILKFK